MASSPGPQYRKQDIDAGLMPETGVDESSSSALDTSADVSGSVGGKGTPTKKGKKSGGKTGKPDKKKNGSAKEEAKAKNMRKKFGIFGGLLGKSKPQQQKTDEENAKSGSCESISSKDSSSDESVIQEARETAQPQDLDASLAASDQQPRDQSTLLQADVSNRSYSVGDQTLNATGDGATSGDDTLTSEALAGADTAMMGTGGSPLAAGVTRTTTHTASLIRHGEATESSVQAVESADGSLLVNTKHQKKVKSCSSSNRVASGGLSMPPRQDGGRCAAPMGASVRRPDPPPKTLV